MAWIESHDDLATHPKTRRAARALGISIPTMVGHLHLLWHWCLKYADDGDLSGYDLMDIADAMMWDGDPDELITALVDCGPGDRHGFLERREDGSLEVHDWLDYAGKLIEQREEARKAGAWGNHVRWHVQRGIIDPDCPHCREATLGETQDNEVPIGERSGGESEPDRDLSHRTVPYLTYEEEEEDARESSSDGQALPESGSEAPDQELLQLAFRTLGGVGPTQLAILDEMVTATSLEVTREALLETERYAAGNKTRYCESVIRDWTERGIKTPDDLTAYRASRKAKPRGRSRADPGESTADRIARLRAGGAL